MTIKGYVVRGKSNYRGAVEEWAQVVGSEFQSTDVRADATEYTSMREALAAFVELDNKTSNVRVLRVHDDGREEALATYEEALSQIATLETRADIAGGNSATLTAIHRIAQDGEQVTVSELWTDAAGAEVSAYRVTLPLATLVHVVLNTTAEERAAIDQRADWRGVPQK